MGATTATTLPATVPAPVPASARDLLGAAARGLLDAALAPSAAARYAAAHLAALRAAAAVVAARARPSGRRSRLRSVWVLLPEVAPELTEWAAFFAAGAGKRAAAEAGLEHVVSAREADDLLRDAETFLALVASALGVGLQTTLPAPTRLRPVG